MFNIPPSDLSFWPAGKEVLARITTAPEKIMNLA